MSTVLIVDDNADSVRPLQLALEHRSHAVVLAADGVEALERLDDPPPHVIVLDLSMPRMDGYGFLDELRRRPAHTATRVLVYTAYASMVDVKRLVALGVTDILIKATVSFDRIIELVEAH